MAEAAACPNHPQKKAVVTCAKCAQRFCSACTTMLAGGDFFCRPCAPPTPSAASPAPQSAAGRWDESAEGGAADSEPAPRPAPQETEIRMDAVVKDGENYPLGFGIALGAGLVLAVIFGLITGFIPIIFVDYFMVIPAAFAIAYCIGHLMRSVGRIPAEWGMIAAGLGLSLVALLAKDFVAYELQMKSVEHNVKLVYGERIGAAVNEIMRDFNFPAYLKLRYLNKFSVGGQSMDVPKPLGIPGPIILLVQLATLFFGFRKSFTSE